MKNALISAGVAILVMVFGFLGLNLKANTVPTDPTDQYAGSPGPDRFNDYFSDNGVATYPRSVALLAATTTPCSIKSPSATTTIARFTLNIRTATSSAGTIVVATSTTPNATSTTPFYSPIAVAANSTRTLTWAGGTENNIVAPNTYVTAGVSGVSYGYTYGGSCAIEFKGVEIGR